MRRSLILFAVFLAAPLAAETFLVHTGQPRAEIVIADKPARMAKLAAEELQTYIEKISGAKLAIVNAPSGGAIPIYVGRSARTDKLQITDDGLKHGAFRIVSGKNWLVLLGRDSEFKPKEPWFHGPGDLPRFQKEYDRVTGEKWGSDQTQLWKSHNRELGVWEQDERGSFNAVCAFLHSLGVRWYLPVELGEIVPKRATIELPKLDRTVQPDFPVRYPYIYGRRFSHSKEETMWQLRLGFNQAPDVIGIGYIAHGTVLVHSRDEVKAAHPEFYALAAGKRITEGSGKPCLSSLALFEQNVKFVRAMFDLYDTPMVSVMPADGYVALCQCDLCKGKDTPARGWDGQLSDYVWGYVNRVAAEVLKSHPHKKVIAMGYGAYRLPPTKIAKLSPNIVVCLAQNRADFAEPASRRSMEEMRKAWLDTLPAGDKQLLIYDYYLHARPNRTYQSLPAYYPHAIAEDLRSLKGVSLGDYIEVYREKGLNAFGVNVLNLYVTARLWWDASQDVDAMLDEFCANFYGPARDEMKAFIAYSEANWRELPKSAAKIDEVLALLARAQQKTPADSVFAKRIAPVADFIQPLKQMRERLAQSRENAPKAIMIERRGAQVKIDGRLDEPAWQHLRTYSLRELRGGEAPGSKTTFNVFWADGAVYFGIRCQERDAKHLRIGATRPDDPAIWRGDCVELMLETQTHAHYQLTISPSGALLDADRKDRIDTAWSSGAEVAAFVGDDFWSVEVRVPVAGDLQAEVDPRNGVAGRRPSVSFPWYFNVCRQRVRDDGTELSAFSPQGKGGFNDRSKFGELTGFSAKPKK